MNLFDYFIMSIGGYMIWNSLLKLFIRMLRKHGWQNQKEIEIDRLDKETKGLKRYLIKTAEPKLKQSNVVNVFQTTWLN